MQKYKIRLAVDLGIVEYQLHSKATQATYLKSVLGERSVRLHRLD